MTQILGAKFNFLTVFGLAVICAAALFGVWKIIDFYLPDKTTENLITVDQIRSINSERYGYEDSLRIARYNTFTSDIMSLVKDNKEKDSILQNFYLKSQSKTNEKINDIDRSNDSDILRLWAERYR